MDDEPGVLEMIKGHFELRGFDVATASDGREGIDLCGTFMPDVILLDLKMKEWDGDKAIPELKKIVPLAKVFVVSAYQDEVMEKRITGLGVSAHFEKPVSILELEKVIRQAVGLSVIPQSKETFPNR